MTKKECLQLNNKSAYNFGISNKLLNHVKRIAKNRNTSVTSLINTIIIFYAETLKHKLVSDSKQNYHYKKCGNDKIICIYLTHSNKALLYEIKHNLECFSAAMLLRTIIMDYLKLLNMEGKTESDRKNAELQKKFKTISAILQRNKSIIKKKQNYQQDNLSVFYDSDYQISKFLII